MVAQRMGSQSCNNGDFVTETLIGTQDAKSNPLGSSSFYNLTLDEVQNQLGDVGKPLGSMNLDELLKSVFTAGDDSGPAPTQSAVPEDLSKKTVDQLWQDIERRSGNLERRTTLGEMTLEDFLVKAGVVAESKSNSGDTNPAGLPPPQSRWMSYPIQLTNPQPVFVPGHPVLQPQPISPPSIDSAFAEAQMAMSSSPMMGSLFDSQTSRRKRLNPEDVAEKSVERRQKRMIKNRESAARSRARKQAYTQELENKVSRLEEENERLKRQKEWETTMSATTPQPEPKSQLRRTSSAPT
ncbi:ABSCISIC ACID-INSENSITIVE 5-like protein 2 [Andrographis paniculata]|uniref:ABSCISIC ACID-INSENSITIVE 5-like protein 2 n=1 Tax=Andrographis paniculata TaxID=175694 RepID=UPI0021E6E81E|nr:ABSCISIC ACID-INSENSITIVE 5-like protein 2 [Andrographis paniculata]XP_051150398.1 ABSCISIC ACID-INSENSITIVE 5-like protein 2 [Andrographis paniculata]